MRTISLNVFGLASEQKKLTDRHDKFVIASASICSLKCIFPRVCGHFQVLCFENPINMNFMEFTTVDVASCLGGGMCFLDMEAYLMIKKGLTKKNLYLPHFQSLEKKNETVRLFFTLIQ